MVRNLLISVLTQPTYIASSYFRCTGYCCLYYVFMQVVCSDQAASYMWGLEVDHEHEGTPAVKLEFSVMYQPLELPDGLHPNSPRSYTSTLDLHDYKVKDCLVVLQ